MRPGGTVKLTVSGFSFNSLTNIQKGSKFDAKLMDFVMRKLDAEPTRRVSYVFSDYPHDNYDMYRTFNG